MEKILPWRYKMAQLGKCGLCGSRLVPLLRNRSKTVYYVCPNMRKRNCEGCYMGEENFIRQLGKLLKQRRIEVVLEKTI